MTVPAWADGAREPTPAQIRAAAEAFDRGREAYQAQDFVAAAEEFERADSQAPSPIALEYAIRSRDKASQLDRAATLAALAAQRHPDDKNLAKVVPDVLERAGSSLYRLTVHCAEACELAVGGKIVHGGSNTERAVFLPPGSHSVRAGFGEDRSDSRDVDVTAGAEGEIRFEVPAASELDAAPAAPAPVSPTPDAADGAPPPEAEAKRSSGWSPAVFWVGAALTGVVGGVTIWSGVDTLNNPGEDRVKEECEAGDTSCAAYQEGLRNQRRTNILLGATAGLGAATILIGALATDWGSGEAKDPTLMRAPGERRAASKGITPFVAIGDGAVIGAQGRF